jgi:hypothetical protein
MSMIGTDLLTSQDRHVKISPAARRRSLALPGG